MSNVARVASTAANTLTKPLSVEDVFSTYLYTGNDTSQTITNGIDLSGEGGMTWLKTRNDTHSHYLFDTERGAGYYLNSDTSGAQAYDATAWVTAFNSDGFDIGYSVAINDDVNDHASWTFRKAPKFFDVVTYTGDGTDGRTISHNLGTTVGSIFVKRLDATAGWYVYHRHYGGTHSLFLNATLAAVDNTSYWNDTNATSTEFTVASNTGLNASGGTYVAYLFAHNDGDGDFGPTGDQDIIKCGSYTGNGSATGPEIDLGFEPQWLLFKDTTNANDWILIDNMRGMVVDNDLANADAYLRPNLSNQEGKSTFVEPTTTGFKVQNNGWTNVSGANVIYIAIRRGPMAVPTDATDVFKVDAEDSGSFNNPPLYVSGFSVDFALRKQTNNGANWAAVSRLTGTNYLQTNSTAAESSVASYEFDYMNGWSSDAGWNAAIYSWMWKRAPSFCDVVAYTGNGLSNVNTVSHNLGVAPEMIWVKRRDSTNDWQVYHSGLNGGTTPEQYSISLNTTGTQQDRTYWNDTAPTSTTFQITDAINGNGDPYIAYLFASLDGVSKVGSYTGNAGASTINVDCGFTNGARFVLIKETSGTGDWWVFDTERGLVAGNDPALKLNTTDAELSADFIDPYSAGFSLQTNSGINTNGATFIFYAIA